VDALYRDYILEHYKNPKNFGTLEPHDIEFHDVNPLCGDELGVHLRVEDGKIADLRFHGQGCAISQAAASITSEELVGMDLDEVARLPREQRVTSAVLPAVPLSRADDES
jgi:nitrogen fixation NifU-like protein